MLGPKSNPRNPWNRIRASSLTTSASRSSLVRLGLLLPVEVDVEVLVGVDAADLVKACRALISHLPTLELIIFEKLKFTTFSTFFSKFQDILDIL